MRLHTLRLRGVGPFRDEFTIDFDDVGGHRLFLIDGDTGTGKSTVIDAIVFALYGRTADDAAGDRMVSDFLPSDFKKTDRPFVELVFTVESGVYRVRREPKYDYVNRNGKQSTQNPTIRLERLANETAATGEPIATSIQEGNAEIHRVVQLNSGQFLATVVLAQGQFATFLRAGPDDRREILERVFSTEAYRRVEELLKQRKSTATSDRNAASGRCQDAAARFHEVADLDIPAEDWRAAAAREPDQVVTTAKVRLLEVSALAESAGAAKAAAQQEYDQAVGAHDAAKQRACLVEEKRQLVASRVELENAEPEIERYRVALLTHAKAQTVEPSRRAKASALADAAKQETAAEVCRKGLDPADAPLATSTVDDLDEVIERAITALAEEEGKLTPIRQLEVGLAEAAARVDQAWARAEALASELDRAMDAAGKLPERIKDLRVQAGHLRHLASVLEPRTTQVGVVQRGLDAALGAVRLGQQHATAKQRLDQAAAALTEATEAAHRVEAEYHSNIAGVLATQLRPDEPCPVCGGADHPKPARAPSGEVSRGAVEAARRELEQRRKATEAARISADNLRAQADTAQALAQHRDVEAWEAEVVAAKAAVSEAQAAASEVAELDARVTRFESEHTKLEERGRELTGQVAAARRDHEQQKHQFAADSEAVTTARGVFDSVGTRLQALRGRRERLRQWQQARVKAAQAQAVAHQADSALSAALAEGGFGAEADVADALLDSDTETRLTAAVAAHRKRQAQVEGRLESSELAAVDPTELVDVAGPAEVVAHMAQKLAAATKVATLAGQQASDATSNFGALLQAAEELQEVAARVAPIIRIADIVNGTGANSLGVPLSHYVVLRRFEDVLEAANSRLLAISDGRYRLEPDTTARQGQKVRRGLGLRIVDERTDQARDVSTLSGGETFYTSLSLALGLADVVAQEAGGVQMRTLFVDEGFGSLDTETLEAVMMVLGALSKGDRMVGVISHVTEMKNSIPFRIHIRRPDRDGPSVILTPS